MNTITNFFEPLSAGPLQELLRMNGEPVPKHWCVLEVGETVVIKNYTFKVAYMNEKSLVLEPVGVPIIDGDQKLNSMTVKLTGRLKR